MAALLFHGLWRRERERGVRRERGSWTGDMTLMREERQSGGGGGGGGGGVGWGG